MKPLSISFILYILIIQGCNSSIKSAFSNESGIMITGVAQDAGYPQLDCEKDCCKSLTTKQKMVSSAALIDSKNKQFYLLDATPDLPLQIKMVKDQTGYSLGGILLTHAHIGHYSGLMYLGRESVNASKVKVYAMPRMKEFLAENGPWEMLVSLKNIEIVSLRADSTFQLSPSFLIQPKKVPHRDEYSETVGFWITGPNKNALYLPDIDKWEKWTEDVRLLIPRLDYAYLDGSFFMENELPGRNMNEIPHPFVIESIEYFSSLSTTDKEKIRFIHFNHTNDLLRAESKAKANLNTFGFNIAEEGEFKAL